MSLINCEPAQSEAERLTSGSGDRHSEIWQEAVDIQAANEIRCTSSGWLYLFISIDQAHEN